MLTTHYLPGSPCWVDVSSPDPETSVSFYTGLFGWDAVSLGPSTGTIASARSAAGLSPASARRPRRERAPLG